MTALSKDMKISFSILLAIAALAVGAGGALYYQNYFGTGIGSGDSSSAIFSVATSTGATYFTVAASGNVGVGVENPTALFEVAGPIRLTKKSSDGCSLATEGEIAYNPDNKGFWGCDGSSWRPLGN